MDFQIDLLQFPVSSRETRAEKTLRLHNLQLRRYYDLNLGQNVWVFILGILCILLGILLTAAAILLVIDKHVPRDAKVLTAVLGAVGTLLTNYVATVYLKMHAVASVNLAQFHSRLVDTHQILFGNLVASRIEDDKTRWSTLAKLAVNVARLRAERKVEGHTPRSHRNRNSEDKKNSEDEIKKTDVSDEAEGTSEDSDSPDSD